MKGGLDRGGVGSRRMTREGGFRRVKARPCVTGSWAGAAALYGGRGCYLPTAGTRGLPGPRPVLGGSKLVRATGSWAGAAAVWG